MTEGQRKGTRYKLSQMFDKENISLSTFSIQEDGEVNNNGVNSVSNGANSVSNGANSVSNGAKEIQFVISMMDEAIAIHNIKKRI